MERCIDTRAGFLGGGGAATRSSSHSLPPPAFALDDGPVGASSSGSSIPCASAWELVAARSARQSRPRSPTG